MSLQFQYSTQREKTVLKAVDAIEACKNLRLLSVDAKLRLPQIP